MIEISWEQYLEQIDKLAKCIKDKYKEWNEDNDGDIINTPYTCIISINRGGNIIGTILSHKFNIPLGIISASKYNMLDRLIMNKHISIIANANTFDNILLVDDIADTGDTLYNCAEYLRPICNQRLHIGTPIYKKQSKVIPDYYVSIAPDNTWVKFPYEVLTAKKNFSNPTELSKAIVDEYKEVKEVEQMKASKKIREFFKEKAQDMGIVKDTRKVTGRAEQVAALLGENPNITNKEICEKTGIHQSYLPRILKKLRGN